MNFSVTWTSALVFLITALLKGSGAETDPASVEGFVLMGASIISAIGVFYGRYRQGDINLFGKKRI